MERCPKCGYSPGKKDPVPYQDIMDYFNQRTGKQFRHSTPATRRLIKARWNEGFKLIDFHKVIDNQAKKWESNPDMTDYLRPQTLFSGKFESYLQNAAPKQAETRRREQPIITGLSNLQKGAAILKTRGKDDFEKFADEIHMSLEDRECVYMNVNVQPFANKMKEIGKRVFK
jgi:uncharacterized phage protein (TIGR02220 family)